MKKIDLTEQKQLLLKIMDHIHEVCEENNIDYTLIGGSLLGAIRHNGFIPWDDDLDIILPRKEFNKLIAILKAQKNEAFILLDSDTPEYKYAFAKLCLTTTMHKSPIKDHPKMGVYVDIFPADALPNEEIERNQFIESVLKQRRNIQFSSIKSYFGAKTYVKAVMKLFLFFPRYVKSRKNGDMQTQLKYLEQFLEENTPKEIKEYANLSSPYFPEKDYYPKNMFDHYIYREFEGRKYKIIADYEACLTHVYGDYMKIPPVEERVDHSYYKWYWK